MSENIIDNVEMDFEEMLTGLFETNFLLPGEVITICKAAELYASAKNKKLIKALQKIEQMSDCAEMKSIATDALRK